MKTISDIFRKRDSELTKLIGQASDSQNLKAIFKSSLDANLAKNCDFANYKDSTLIVTVTNSSWATRLRYAIPDIIKNLQVQPEFEEITNIRYTVVAPNKKKNKAKKIPAKMSKESERIWRKTLSELKSKVVRS